MSFLGSIAGMVAREGAEAGAGALLRRQAGKIVGEKAAQFAAGELGQRAAARVVGERGAAYLASQSGQRATKFVVGQETKRILHGDKDGGSSPSGSTPQVTAAPPSDIRAPQASRSSRSQSGGSRLDSMRLGGGESWWKRGSLVDAQKANYDWRTFSPDTIAKGPGTKSLGLGRSFKEGLSNAVINNVSRGTDEVAWPTGPGQIGPGSVGALGEGSKTWQRTTSFPELGPGPSYEGTSSRNGAFNDGRVNGAIPVAPPAPLARGPLVVPPPKALGPGATAPVYDPVAEARSRPAGASTGAIKRTRAEWPGQPGVRY